MEASGGLLKASGGLVKAIESYSGGLVKASELLQVFTDAILIVSFLAPSISCAGNGFSIATATQRRRRGRIDDPPFERSSIRRGHDERAI